MTHKRTKNLYETHSLHLLFRVSPRQHLQMAASMWKVILRKFGHNNNSFCGIWSLEHRKMPGGDLALNILNKYNLNIFPTIICELESMLFVSFWARCLLISNTAQSLLLLELAMDFIYFYWLFWMEEVDILAQYLLKLRIASLTLPIWLDWSSQS